LQFLKKPATTMASYTGLVAMNHSSAVGSNSAFSALELNARTTATIAPAPV
jgi:hypothetical protein